MYAPPAPLMENMVKIHQYAIMCASVQAQVAAEEALKRGREDGYADVETMRQSYNRRRRLMLSGFRKMGLDCFEPLGAFYVFPSIRKTGMTSEAFCETAPQEKEVACVPGTAFGACGEGFIRCCYATALDKLTVALERIDDFLQSICKPYLFWRNLMLRKLTAVTIAIVSDVAGACAGHRGRPGGFRWRTR